MSTGFFRRFAPKKGQKYFFGASHREIVKKSGGRQSLGEKKAQKPLSALRAEIVKKLQNCDFRRIRKHKKKLREAFFRSPVHCTTPDHATLHHATLRDITLPYHTIVLRHAALHCTARRRATPHYVALHFVMSRCATLHYVALHKATPRYAALRYT